MARLAAAGGSEMPEVDVEGREREPPGVRSACERQVIRAAPRSNRLQRTGISGVDEHEVAIVGQREELSAVQPTFKVLRGCREADETIRPKPGECAAVVPDLRRVRVVVGRVVDCLPAWGDLEQPAVGGHSIERSSAVLGELQTGHNRCIARCNRDAAQVPTLSVGKPLIGGGIGTARRSRAAAGAPVELR